MEPILADGNPANSMRDCIMGYEDDMPFVVTSREMHAELSERGEHEGVLLEFPPGRGHSSPF
jgi:hypothetical protein